MWSRKSVALTLSVLTGCLIGCQRVNSRLAEGIRRGQRQYAAGNFVGAERVLSSAIAVQPSSPAAAEAYYIRGLTRLKQGQVQGAEADFICAVELAERDDLETNCRICLGSIAHDRGDWRGAYEQYDKVADRLPSVSPNDWILYRLGDSAQKIGKWSKARKYFGTVIREFPNSQAATLAKRKLKFSYFTIQAGAFSRAANARARVALLEKANLPARRETRNRNGKPLQIVYVGKYGDFASAAGALERVKTIVSDARIVP